MARNSSATAEKTTSRQLAETAARMAALRAKALVEDAEAELDRQRLEAAKTELDQLDAWAAEQREQEHKTWLAERRRGEEQFAALKTLITTPVPTLPIGIDEAKGQLAKLDTFLNRVNAAEKKALIDEVERDRKRCVIDPAFRTQYNRAHPGGLDQCGCMAHRAARGEDI